jgi:hypothetical protein
MRPPSPPLHLGWRKDDPALPVYLRSEGLTAHIAIMAQSGSGKSFMLGRLLEEVASKTRARFLILDPNSDFSQFGCVDGAAWQHPKGRFGAGDTRNAFKRRWSAVGFNVLSNNVGTLPISLSWARLSSDMKQNYLGLSAITSPEEYASFQMVEGAINEYQKVIKRRVLGDSRSLERYAEAANAMWHAEALDRALTPAKHWLARAFPKRTNIVSPQAALNLYGRINHLLRLDFWDKRGTNSIQLYVHTLGHSERVLCIDLGSLPSPEHALVTAAVALDTLWLKARDEWTKAQARPAGSDSRCPVGNAAMLRHFALVERQ